MAEGSVHPSSFKKFLKTVGIESNSSALPCTGAGVKSASTFYAHSSEVLTECKVPSKRGWLFKQSRGVLRSWQVGHDQKTAFIHFVNDTQWVWDKGKTVYFFVCKCYWLYSAMWYDCIHISP